MIEVKNLTKRYGDNIAVDDLSFTVENGQIYGFLGPNGAGKSTTMNIITGYLAATDGYVLIDDIDILQEPEKAKAKIGYLPEIPPLYNDMTVKEFLDFVAELKKVPKSERKDQVEKVMEETHITDMSRRMIRNLSKGYKQRVGMAQAMIGNPDVLIFDEPTVGLDPKQIIEVRELIKSLGKEHTVILSSHILSEVSAVCDHIMIISNGRMVANGSPEDLQNMMGNSAEILITVLGDPERAVDALKGLEGIDDVVSDGMDENGNGHIRVVSPSNADVREKVSIALSENRVAIMGMERREKSLEDIFLELTDEKRLEELLFAQETEGSGDNDNNLTEKSADSEESDKEANEESDKESNEDSDDDQDKTLINNGEEDK